MLNIKIYSFEEKNPAIKYHTGFSSWEDDSVELALEIYEKEQFDILEKYLDVIYEYVADRGHGIMKDSSYVVSVMACIIVKMRKNEEKYNKFLEYLIGNSYRLAEYMYQETLGEIKRMESKDLSDCRNREYIEKCKSYIERPFNRFDREKVEHELLKSYKIVYALVE
jgi:hypothetical protein